MDALECSRSRVGRLVAPEATDEALDHAVVYGMWMYVASDAAAWLIDR